MHHADRQTSGGRGQKIIEMVMIWSGEVLRFWVWGLDGAHKDTLLRVLGTYRYRASRGREGERKKKRIKCNLNARGQRRGMQTRGSDDGISQRGFLAFCIPGQFRSSPIGQGPELLGERHSGHVPAIVQ